MGDVRGPHHPFILQRMFVHATESGQKEAEKLICHSCWAGRPRLDPEADVPAIQLVEFWTSREEIGELFHQVFMLKRLPGPPSCGPKWAQEATRDILSSLKDHLRWRRGDYLAGSGGLEPASTHQSYSWDGASQRERQDTSGEWELAEAREAHWQALAAASILEERIERLSQSTTRTRPDNCHCSQSRDQSRRRSRGLSRRCHKATPGEGSQALSLRPSSTRLHWWVTLWDL